MTRIRLAVGALCASVSMLASANGAVKLPEIKASNTLYMAHSNIFWNDNKIDGRTLNRLFAATAKIRPEPKVIFKTDSTARYDEVAKTLAEAQRSGAVHIGFSGIDRYDEKSGTMKFESVPDRGTKK